MLTVIETPPSFSRQAADYWTEGKRGGVRVVYFNRLANGEVWLLLIYAKNVRPPRMAEVPETQEQCSGQDNIPGHVIKNDQRGD